MPRNKIQRIKDAAIEAADPRKPIAPPKVTRRAVLAAAGRAVALGIAAGAKDPETTIQYAPRVPRTK